MLEIITVGLALTIVFRQGYIAQQSNLSRKFLMIDLSRQKACRRP